MLSVAGSDSSAGAGIQADLKGAMAERVYAATVVTAVTAQSSSGIYSILPLKPSLVVDQLEAVVSDFRPDAVKLGMIPSVEVGRVVLEFLQNKLSDVPVVVDPVLKATSGKMLADDTDALIDFYITHLLPYATVSTPNYPEAALLASSGCETPEVEREEDSESLGRRLAEILGLQAVVVKGGHCPGNEATDALVWLEGNHFRSITERHLKIDCPNLHGTGCTFSTLLACQLAQGMPLAEAFREVCGRMQKIIVSSCGYRFGDSSNGFLNTGNFKTVNQPHII